jgi:hypothetical protein
VKLTAFDRVEGAGAMEGENQLIAVLSDGRAAANSGFQIKGVGDALAWRDQITAG